MCTKGDSIEGVLHVSPGRPKTKDFRIMCRRLPLLVSL
jgi:hypothetical protein